MQCGCSFNHSEVLRIELWNNVALDPRSKYWIYNGHFALIHCWCLFLFSIPMVSSSFVPMFYVYNQYRYNCLYVIIPLGHWFVLFYMHHVYKYYIFIVKHPWTYIMHEKSVIQCDLVIIIAKKMSSCAIRHLLVINRKTKSNTGWQNWSTF
jgi:hypothetical protein